jgi:hypothetical protein
MKYLQICFRLYLFIAIIYPISVELVNFIDNSVHSVIGSVAYEHNKYIKNILSTRKCQFIMQLHLFIKK